MCQFIHVLYSNCRHMHIEYVRHCEARARGWTVCNWKTRQGATNHVDLCPRQFGFREPRLLMLSSTTYGNTAFCALSAAERKELCERHAWVSSRGYRTGRVPYPGINPSETVGSGIGSSMSNMPPLMPTEMPPMPLPTSVHGSRRNAPTEPPAMPLPSSVLNSRRNMPSNTQTDNRYHSHGFPENRQTGFWATGSGTGFVQPGTETDDRGLGIAGAQTGYYGTGNPGTGGFDAEHLDFRDFGTGGYGGAGYGAGRPGSGWTAGSGSGPT